MNHPDDAAAQSGAVDRRMVLFVVSLESVAGGLIASSLNIAIPSIGKEFAADAVTLAWIATAPILGMAVFLVPMGKIADIYGRKKVFLYGLLAWTVLTLVCGFAPSSILLIGALVLQSISAAMHVGTSTAIVTSAYPPRERGHALGITIASVYFGLSAGPFVGGVLTQHLGWRSLFFLVAGLGAATTAMAAWKMRAEWAEARGERLDLVGSAIFGIALLAVMYGVSRLPSALGAGLILLGMVFLAAFVWWERRVPNPVLDINLFRHNPVFALSNLASLIIYSATSAIAFLLSLYLQYVKGLDPQTAGLVLLAQPIMMFVFSPFAGRLSDRVEPRVVASTGMALTTIGLALLAFLDDAAGLGYIVVALLFVGFGFALFSSPNTNAIMGSVDRRFMGIASATLAVVRSMGMMLSLGIATSIISVYVGGVQITPQYHESFFNAFRLSFIIFAVLCFAGILCSLARGNLHVEEPTGSSAATRPTSRR